MFAERDKYYPSRSGQTSLVTAVTNITKPVTKINFGPSTSCLRSKFNLEGFNLPGLCHRRVATPLPFSLLTFQREESLVAFLVRSLSSAQSREVTCSMQMLDSGKGSSVWEGSAKRWFPSFVNSLPIHLVYQSKAISTIFP